MEEYMSADAARLLSTKAEADYTKQELDDGIKELEVVMFDIEKAALGRKTSIKYVNSVNLSNFVHKKLISLGYRITCGRGDLEGTTISWAQGMVGRSCKYD